MLWGTHCAGRAYTKRDWVLELLGEHDPGDLAASEARRWLEDLRAYAQAEFARDDSAFQPLLPADDAPMEQRVRALGSWCQGFMVGLGTGCAGREERLSGDLREVLDDLQQLARIEPDPEETDEDAELAYTELVEYVRVGVMLIRAQLNDVPAMPIDLVH